MRRSAVLLWHAAACLARAISTKHLELAPPVAFLSKGRQHQNATPPSAAVKRASHFEVVAEHGARPMLLLATGHRKRLSNRKEEDPTLEAVQLGAAASGSATLRVSSQQLQAGIVGLQAEVVALQQSC
mmetsp:Transcript_91124/g.167294  ORF Transcript_91124/g.167294 Transcript_91124/m.167294 type:complete len:128 (-) Transcript_91124:3-386(-)